MEYRNLGGCGLHVSEVGLGGNNFGSYCDEAQSLAVIRRALDLGVNFIDTADRYAGTRSEEYLGKAIAGIRHQVILATKVGHTLGNGPNDQGLSYGRILSCCDASLRRLGTDYIDLYFLHRPDPLTPLKETLSAMNHLVYQGKVRYIGVSNYPAWQVCQALWISDRHGYRPPVVSENPYNLLNRTIEGELLPFCRAHGIGIVPYFPLASGLLTGKYRAGEPPPPGTRGHSYVGVQRLFTKRNFALVAALEDLARSRGHTVSELAIAWLLSHAEVPSVIPGATKPEQVEANVAAAAWKLNGEELQEIEAALARVESNG